MTNERDISDEDIKAVFKDYSYFEVSAKNGYNISLAFDKLRKLVVENIKAKDNNPTVKQRKLSHEKNKKGTLEDIESHHRHHHHHLHHHLNLFLLFVFFFLLCSFINKPIMCCFLPYH